MWPVELEHIHALTKNVPYNGIVVEIGVLEGRSAAVYLIESRNKPLEIHLVDAWVLNESDTRPRFLRLAANIGQPFIPHWKQSKEAIQEIPDGIDLLHIDGDHREGAWDDCRLYLPKVKIGGTVIVHDYDDPDYPEVEKAADFYINESTGWDRLGVVGRLLTATKINNGL